VALQISGVLESKNRKNHTVHPCTVLANQYFLFRLQVDRNLMLYDWPFSSKPIDLGLGFQVHWAHIKLGFPPSSLVGTLNMKSAGKPHGNSFLFWRLLGGHIHL
jgi:hypothetical protein